MYNLTQEQLNEINDVLNKDLAGEESPMLDGATAATFFSMANALARHLYKENKALKSQLALKTRQLERMGNKFRSNKQEIIENEWFGSTGLDSLTVSRAFLHVLQEQKFYLTKDKFWSLLYMAYSSFLYHFEKTLFIEHPVAIKQGPRFWREKDLNVTSFQDRSVWIELTEQDPAVAKFLKNYALKYGNHSEKDLSTYIERSEPFRKAMESAKLAGKQSFPISDKDIYLWKAEEKNK